MSEVIWAAVGSLAEGRALDIQHINWLYQTNLRV
jgi:hypothetical protein